MKFHEFSGHKGPVIALVLVQKPMSHIGMAMAMETAIAEDNDVNQIDGAANANADNNCDGNVETGESGLGTRIGTGSEDIIYSASLDNTIRCWNAEMICFAMLREPSSEISAMQHVPSTNLLFTGMDNGQIHLWNVDSGSAIVLKEHTNTVTSMAL